MRNLILGAAAAATLLSCEPIEIEIETQENDIGKRMWFTATIDDTTIVNETFVVCPTTLIGSEAKDSTNLYWIAADQDMALVNIDSVEFFFCN